MERLRSRLRYLMNDTDPDGVEILAALLSLSFGVVMAVRGRDSNAINNVYIYTGLCFLSAALKLTGVVCEVWWMRVAGLLLGVIFWFTISAAFLLTIPGSISWLCFLVLALSQLWAVRQVMRRTTRPLR